MKKQMRARTLSVVIAAAAVAGLAAPAFAQETPPPGSPPAATPEVKRVARTSGDVGSGGLGLGATAFISGLVGPQVVYDFGVWHLEGTLAFASTPMGPMNERATVFDFGVGGWYHLHMGENSDFSVGGRFGLINASPPGPGNSATGFEFEPGAQIRAFITPNVALHGGLGLIFEFGDAVPPLDKTIGLFSNITSNLGFTYYFR